MMADNVTCNYHYYKDDGASDESQARRSKSCNSAPCLIEEQGLSYNWSQPEIDQNVSWIVQDHGYGAASNCQLLRNDYSTLLAQASSSGASLRRLFSLSASWNCPPHLEEEIVSQAGDIGDNTISRRESFQFAQENRTFVSPPSSTSLLQEQNKELPPSFEYIAYLVHLAVFGILGVLTRYLLQKLFGASVIGVTSDQTILYADLPSNMVGSFLMGWFGVVFKGKISHISDHLAVGLSTGYLGSVTTFSGWNQKMLDLSVNGHWVFAVLGFLIGLFLAAYSIIIGIETAKGFRWILERNGNDLRLSKLRVHSFKSHVILVTVLMLMWGGLMTTSGIFEKKKFKDGGSGAQLWLGCLVCPIGVWLRWWLARFNGRGLGNAERWKWIPLGTLVANVSAACVMAALATVKKAANTKNYDTVAGGIQLGLVGCLSTVSTFMAEYNAMRESSHPWRAYTYAFTTIGISFALGTLIYSVPVRTMG